MGAVTYHVYYRVIFNFLALVLHTGNSIAMYLAMQGDVLEDPDVRILKETQFKYITIWNVAFQMTFLGMSLVCDIPLILKIFEDFVYLDYLRSYRKLFFSSIVWPLTLSISSVFWPVFIYDRELIFPAYIDKALSPVSNHIMHTAIVIIVFWELLFQPRSKPTSHKWHLAHFAVVYIAYLIVLFTNYAERGIWPYPALKLMYGTVYFPILIIALPILGLFYYFIQWPLTTLIFQYCIKNEKIR